jgi:hypothetical protein
LHFSVPSEEAIAAKLETQQAQQEATEAKRRVEQLADRLRQLGINPDEI